MGFAFQWPADERGRYAYDDGISHPLTGMDIFKLIDVPTVPTCTGK
jgi:hypothetical protein